jgi:hypothetical protein
MTSMPMAIYLEWRADDCDVAAGCSVQGNVTLSGGCGWFGVPGGRLAFASYFGPCETLHETDSAIRIWCAAQRLKPSGP